MEHASARAEQNLNKDGLVGGILVDGDIFEGLFHHRTITTVLPTRIEPQLGL